MTIERDPSIGARYGVGPDTRWFAAGDLEVEAGVVLGDVQVAYRTWGRLNEAGDNAILVCHALTADHNADLWWGDAIGPGRGIDTDRWFVVCANVLGSCYGTTGPPSPHPERLGQWGGDFPHVTIRDIVALQHRLVEHLGITRLALVVGGSMGGMQVLEWALMYPERVAAIAPISVGAYHSPWCIGTSEAQRQAIFADPRWNGGHYDPDHPPTAGLAVARQIAIVSYRSPASFKEKFGRRQEFGSNADEGLFDVESYLRYQGEALVRRFDAASYVTLTYAMDSHDVGRERGEIEDVLGKLDVPALVIGISSDTLYPVDEQHVLADLIPDARYEELDVPHGHDGFLIEHQAVSGLVGDFLADRMA